MEPEKWVRPSVMNLKPYSSARDEYSGEALVFLDANENPFNHPYNRYPDPLQRKLKEKISGIKKIPSANIFLGNGSDEPIDLIIKAFCEPGIHNILQIEPTYGMYQVAAGINNVTVNKVLLTPDYRLDARLLLAAVTPRTHVIFLCSPNNPTGNALNPGEMEKVVMNFPGPVVIDEAYIDFCPGASMLTLLPRYENLIVLQTFSKAWGMAGIRLGMAFADSKIIRILNKIKYPYNLNILTQQKALELLENQDEKEKWVKILLEERKKLSDNLNKIPFVKKVFPSDANFLLVKMKNARRIYESLVKIGVIVRDRSKIVQCEECLRITVGTPQENRVLVEKLKLLNIK